MEDHTIVEQRPVFEDKNTNTITAMIRAKVKTTARSSLQ